MQIISSLIRMQERVGTSSDETIRRVQAMALVHDLIYTQGQFAAVDPAGAPLYRRFLAQRYPDAKVFRTRYTGTPLATGRVNVTGTSCE